MLRHLFLLVFWATTAISADISAGPNFLLHSESSFSISSYRPFLLQWERFRWDCYHRYGSLSVDGAIVIKGKIAEGDSRIFSQFAKEYAAVSEETDDCPNAVVVLDSQGGEIREAIEIGRQIAKLGFATIVGPEAECLSACIFMLAGGSYKSGFPSHMVAFTGAKIGIHQPQFDPSKRDRQLLNQIDEDLRIDLSFRLAGEEWKNITSFMINERRNAYLMRRLLTSPQEAEKFDYLDTYEELFFAGISVINSDVAAMTAEKQENVEIESRSDYLNAENSRRICSLQEIKSGSLADYSDSYSTQIRDIWIVGNYSTNNFCLAHASDGVVTTCSFERDFFQGDENQYPAWFSQWQSNASGNFPIMMFDHDNGQDVDWDTEIEQEIGSFLQSNFFELTLCTQKDMSDFFIHELEGFTEHLRISTDCDTPTRLCE